MQELLEYYLDHFERVCTNCLPVTDQPYKYRHPDLCRIAMAAKERGEENFYYHPIDPKYPQGRLMESNPEYEYVCNIRLSSDEFMKLISYTNSALYYLLLLEQFVDDHGEDVQS